MVALRVEHVRLKSELATEHGRFMQLEEDHRGLLGAVHGRPHSPKKAKTEKEESENSDNGAKKFFDDFAKFLKHHK